MRRVILIPVLALAMCLSNLSPAGPKAEKADIRGTVKSLTVRKGDEKVLAVILIEGTRDKDTSYDKASVKITKATKLIRVDAKDRRAATVEDLKEGTKVEANFTGPVAESYPVQATAGEVRIFVEGKGK